MDRPIPQDRTTNPALLVAPPGSRREETSTLGPSKARRSNDSTMLSSSTRLSEWSYTQHSSQFTPSCPKTPHSPTNNVPKASSFMRGDSNKPLLPECKLSLEGSACDLNSEASTLLQRMGLGNQLLMARLGLPLKAPANPNPTIYSCSNRVLDNRVAPSDGPARKRGPSVGITLGTGTNPGGGTSLERYRPRPLICLRQDAPPPERLCRQYQTSCPES